MPYDPQVGRFTKAALLSQLRRVRRRPLPPHLFVKGPIPISLIARCRALHRDALAVLLRLKAEADTLGVPIIAGAALARSIGLHPKTQGRILAALERGELIEVERGRGKAPRVTFAPGVFAASY